MRSPLPVRAFFAAALPVLLVGWSLAVRAPAGMGAGAATTSDASSRAGGKPSAPATPATLLLDLDDDLNEAARKAIADRLARAIAPAAWPRDALGAPLSPAAALYRLEGVPASEVADVLSLAALEDIEGIEIEGVHRVPPAPAPDESPAFPAPSRDPGAERPAPVRPNDPFYPHQWHLDQVQMPEAWAVSRGDGVVVAVLDTGVSLRDREGFRGAPDLAGTPMVPGWDFIDGDDRPDDDHGHGTHVAGTIAQTTNNRVGVAGVAPGARIMPVRVLDARGAGRWGTVAAGIRWAVDHGAQVLNLSLGGSLPSATIRRAVEHARRNGVFVVAAAGNSGSSRVGYPAGHEGAFAVGAVRFDRTLTFYSNHGKGLDLVAPGGDIRVDQNGDGIPDGVLQNMPLGPEKQRYDYVPLMGTSMAAPHVAGIAALLIASGVADHPDALGRLLRGTTAELGDPHLYGAGLVQARDALLGGRRERAGLLVLLTALLGALAGLAPGRGRLPGATVGAAPRLPMAPVLAVAGVLVGGLGLLAPVLPTALGPFLGGLPRLAAASASGGGADLAILALAGVWLPLALQAVAGGLRWGPAMVAGTALGVAGLCLGEALMPTRHFLSVGVDRWVGPWLVLQSVLSLGLVRLLRRRLPGEGPTAR
ncbi:MAG TPA: S8 family serine peptidase [Polyangiaceae bacterium LLY-WYZ-14_1]|nr:S8 family serine peptidase [Polyangiaceae bacterium LLY-WYZ-14_1]